MDKPIVLTTHEIRMALEQGEVVSKLDAMKIADDLAAIRTSLAKQHYKPGAAGKDFAWLEANWTAQSAQFAIDLVPIVHRLMLAKWKRNESISLLDIGAGSGAGANVWASLHRGDMIWSRMTVDAVDVNAGRDLFARLYFPPVNYIVGDAFELGSTWDVVICSHVVEHVPDPASFIAKVCRIAKKFAIFYAPYDERDRIAGHVNTITEGTFAAFSPIETQIVKSMGWRAAKPDDKCIIAVLTGTAT